MMQPTITEPTTGIADADPRSVFPGTKPRMLLIVNPFATTVSGRLKNLVVYALRGRYDIEAVETQRPNHATELTRQAVGEGFDLVVSFGGDGTLNEAANGLAGSDLPLSILPGGSTNVVCRMLGIPTDVVDATEHLLQLADDLEPRRIDMGRVNGRYFLFSSGVGIDADVTRWVDAHPRLKARGGDATFTLRGVAQLLPRLSRPAAAARGAGRRPPRRGTERDRAELRSVHVLPQDAAARVRGHRDGRRHDLADGRCAAPRSCSTRRASCTGCSRARAASPSTARPRASRASSSATVRSLDGRDLPLEVDGDYIGACPEAVYEAAPDSLLVIA